VAGYEEIQANHRKVLEVGGGSPRPHRDCEPGVLDGNPVAEEIHRAADLLPPTLSICLVEGRHGGLAGAVAGPWQTAFTSAVAMVRRWYECPAPGPFELAVASGGGAPFDATLIQAHKGLDAACRFLAEGGELLYVADLSGGAGSPDMEPFLKRPSPDEILRRLGQGWIQYGHTTLRIVDKTSRFRVHLVSRLDPELAIRLGFEPADDPAEVIEAWRRRRSGVTAAVLPGPPVYPARS
jgi:nickel-dependent lactate racemase